MIETYNAESYKHKISQVVPLGVEVALCELQNTCLVDQSGSEVLPKIDISFCLAPKFLILKL